MNRRSIGVQLWGCAWTFGSDFNYDYSAFERGLDGLWACTTGSTLRHSVATRAASGGAATTNKTASEGARKPPREDPQGG